MHTSAHPSLKSVPSPKAADHSSLDLIRQLAKKLQRAALADELSISLPVLRRLLAAKVLVGISLPQLQRRRNLVQRKHLLQLLALEAGFASWETYRAALVHMAPEQLPHFDLFKRQQGYPNHWFASLEEAQDYAWEHGGRAVAVGGQAVVIAQH